MLGCRIEPHVGSRQEAEHRTDIDDPSAAPCPHVRKDRLYRAQDAEYIGGEQCRRSPRPSVRRASACSFQPVRYRSCRHGCQRTIRYPLGPNVRYTECRRIGPLHRSGVSKSRRRPAGESTTPAQVHPERSPWSSMNWRASHRCDGRTRQSRMPRAASPATPIHGEIRHPPSIWPLSLEPPIDPSSLTRWRKRPGEAGVEELLAETIEAAARDSDIGTGIEW